MDNLSASVPFIGPEAQERQRRKSFASRVGANESVFGPSPRVLEEIKRVSEDIWMYADPESFELKQALAIHNEINKENIVIGEGIDGLLGYLCRLFVDREVNIVTSRGAYPTFNYHVSGFGGNLSFVPYKNDFEDLDRLLYEANKRRASIIYLANPDNPMGTFHSKTKVEDMISNLPRDCLLCLDEAYSEFVPKSELAQIDPENTQVIRMRTFSKGYGLAGARVGYAIGSRKIIKSFEKIRNHFGVNIVGQRAAKSALEDQDYLNFVVNSVALAKDEIGRIASASGLTVIPSSANFVAIDCGKDSSFALSVLNGLIKNDIFVRKPLIEPQSRCIRVTAGKPEDLALLGRVLPKVIKSCSS